MSLTWQKYSRTFVLAQHTFPFHCGLVQFAQIKQHEMLKATRREQGEITRASDPGPPPQKKKKNDPPTVH